MNNFFAFKESRTIMCFHTFNADKGGLFASQATSTGPGLRFSIEVNSYLVQGVFFLSEPKCAGLQVVSGRGSRICGSFP